MSGMTRRGFLAMTGATVGAGLVGEFAFFHLRAAKGIENPLSHYPERGWEEYYRDLYAYDRKFSFVCSPNCTHACRMTAVERNGVVTRIEPAYDVARYKDVDGHSPSAHWHPRGCNKGYTIHRRVYGPYRLKYPMVRRGWKRWADDGFPFLTDDLRKRYGFMNRGQDTFVRVTWDEAFRYAAQGFDAVARHYSGPEGKTRLADQGYPPEMLEAMHGAGTRTIKCRGGMGVLGFIGKYGLYRFSNMLALLDARVRGVDEKDALGGRKWSNYTWHGDQSPGFPYVHGLQSSDCDLNDMRNAKLHIQIGKNLVENKMTESHFFIELIERGAKIVTITPEYGPAATKASYWIPVRPGATDTALFLAVSKILIDEKKYDEAFVKRHTDFPLLVRTDTLERLRASDVFPDYQLGLEPDGPSFKEQGLEREQYERLGDYVAFDQAARRLVPITRDDVGDRLAERKIDPQLEWKGRAALRDGSEVEVQTLWEMYKVHLRDYDVDTAHEICSAPKEAILQLARDIGDPENWPIGVHIGEGINHWFHATEANRAICLPMILTGNLGKPGAGFYAWSGNYKAAVFQASPEVGPGFYGWIAEDPFHANLDPGAPAKSLKINKCAKDEEPAYWNRGDRPLIVDTPKGERVVFTGDTHMPTPTKALWFTNVNLFNNAKWAYDAIKNVNPLIDMIVAQDIEMTASCEYSDIVFAANSWMEFETLEVTSSCSNPFLQIWKGGIPPVFDTRDDVAIIAGVAKALGEEHRDVRFADYWRFALEKRTDVYIDRLLQGSIPTQGMTVADIMAGKFGEPGAALLAFRTYPRIPFFEQVQESKPFFTDTGRLNAYSDIPEAIACGENFIVHREGPEATPYLPNVIVSSNPFVRPENYGVTPALLQSGVLDADLRTIANNKLPWSEAKRTKNPLWEAGYRFFCLTPKTRHRVHSQWSVTDWNLLWDSNFADSFRKDKRTPGVGEHQININPEAAKAMGLADGDYVYVDANPTDRPYRGHKPDDPFYKTARLMLRVKFNPAYPYDVVMIKHGAFMSTERSVLAHESRPDGLARSSDTGYQSNFRFGSHQSLTRDWSMPMHQTDSLFHKTKSGMHFMFGGEADNHALNTVPKETLVRVVRAEAGGLEGKGAWPQAAKGFAPRAESEFMRRYIAGSVVRVEGRTGA
ncbi:MAG: molybdopterin-dependent oxidoreductase [Fimbriimonadaceae bacterium]|nr:molybdopterin-dependent oxidoreductase [Fimbriimonadaceae bacterium]